MCNINVLLPKNPSRDILELANTASHLSFSRNSDGDGALTIKGDAVHVQKSTHKLILRDVCDAYVLHERLATHGAKSETYAHPFERERYVLVHNGMLPLYSETHSDTYLYCDMLDENLKKYGDILTAIKRTHEGIKTGSFSIVLYDKLDGSFYYYKNDSTSFYTLTCKAGFFGSTSKENIEYARKYLKAMKSKIYTPKSYVIYTISPDGLHKVGKIKRHATPTYAPSMAHTYGYYPQYDAKKYWDDLSTWLPKEKPKAQTYKSPYLFDDGKDGFTYQ